MEYALITGASMGLGSAFAKELARRGYNLLLLSLPDENIETVATHCRVAGVECHTYEIDLTDRGQLLAFTEEVNAKYNVSILINNAGIGGSRRFLGSSIEYIDTIIKLNIEASTLLVHQLLPNLMGRQRGYILNISSMASCTPIGYKTVYPASKEYIRHFSRGLHEELKGTGVSVTVALLGPMPTSEEIKRRIEAQHTIGKFLTITTQKAARVSVDATLKGRAEVVVGAANRISLKLLKLIPVSICAKIATQTIKRELQ